MDFLSTCALHPPSLSAWIYAVTIHGACCVLGAVPLALVLYRLRHEASSTWRLVTSFALGAITAATVAVYKDYLAAAVNPPTTVMLWMGRFLLSTFGFSCFFKSVHAAAGQYPIGADADMRAWIQWFVLLPEPSFAKGKMFKASTTQIAKRVSDLFIKLVVLSLLVSLLLQTPQTTLMDAFLEPGQQETLPTWFITTLNGFAHLWMLYLFASFCLDFSAVGNTLTTGGLHLEPGFANPLLASRTLRQAWGVRWNKPVEVMLKRAVYTPLRRQWGWTRPAAALATFGASGLLHEYNFYVHNGPHYEPGKAILFFMLMGLLMMAEEVVFQSAPALIKTLASHIPTPFVSMAWTLVAAWPFERYFIQSWKDAGLVQVLAQLLPTIQC